MYEYRFNVIQCLKKTQKLQKLDLQYEAFEESHINSCISTTLQAHI